MDRPAGDTKACEARKCELIASWRVRPLVSASQSNSSYFNEHELGYVMRIVTAFSGLLFPTFTKATISANGELTGKN